MSDFTPGPRPTFEGFWDSRPFGPDFSLDPREITFYDLLWSGISFGSMALWTRRTGMGASLNSILGQIFFPTKELVTYNQYGRAYAHTFGASPSFTGGVFRMIGKAAVPLAVADIAVTAAFAGREVGGSPVQSGAYRSREWVDEYHRLREPISVEDLLY